MESTAIQSAIDYLKGQFATFSMVNAKVNHGYTFSLRNLNEGVNRQSLPGDQTSIRGFFEQQFFEYFQKIKKREFGPLTFEYKDQSWDDVRDAFDEWLFKFVDDPMKDHLSDHKRMFLISNRPEDADYRTGIANEIINKIKLVTNATGILHVEYWADKPPWYYDGYTFLLESPTDYYELCIGEFF